MRYFICLFIILLAACSTSEEKIAEVSLRFVKEVSFDIDSMTPSFPDGNASIFRHQGKEYYVHGNKKKFCLQFFDIQAQKLSFEVPLQREGEDGIGSFNHFFVKSLDSIYVVYSHTYSMWRINKEGKILEKHNWVEQAKGDVFQSIFEEVLFNADTLHFIVASHNYPDYPIAQWLCLKTGETGFRYKLPNIYKEANYFYGALFTSRCEGKNKKTVYSFQIDEHLYYADYHSNSLVRGALVKSRYMEIVPSKGGYKDMDVIVNTAQKDTKEKPLYTRIMYDEYRNLYYRIGKLGKKEEAESEAITVMILDEKFQVLGEHYFDAKENLSFNFAFVAQEGLYIGLLLSHPSFNEDKIMFHCYVPEISK